MPEPTDVTEPSSPAPSTAGGANLALLAVDVAVELAAAGRPADLLARLLACAVDAVAAQRGIIARVVDGHLVVEASYERDAEVSSTGQLHTSAEYRFAARAIAEGRPIMRHRADAEVRSPTRTNEASRPHEIVVPLKLAGEVAAVLLVARTLGSAFSPDDTEALTMVGNVCVLAMSNARLVARAQEAAQETSTVLSLAAHELRAPLSVINGYLSILHEGTLGDPPDAWRRPLEVVEEKTAELSALVEDILVAARLDGGDMAPHRCRLDLRDIARAAVTRALGRSTLLDAALTVSTPDLPVVVDADPQQIGRVLDNLINNALTYASDDRRVEVRVSAGDPARVSVQDHGVGIPSEAQARIFKRFVRLKDSSLSRRPGSGLGLPLARELAERNGALLELAASTPGEGSTFVLSLRGSASGVAGGLPRI